MPSTYVNTVVTEKIQDVTITLSEAEALLVRAFSMNLGGTGPLRNLFQEIGQSLAEQDVEYNGTPVIGENLYIAERVGGIAPPY